MKTKIVPRTKENKWRPGADNDGIDDLLTNCLVAMAKLHGRLISHTTLQAGSPLVNNWLTVKLSGRAVQRGGFTAGVERRL